MANVVRQARDWFGYWYLQYELVTAIYLLEPWEKRIVNSVMAGIAFCTGYACYHYLPHYSTSLYNFATGGSNDHASTD